MIPEPNQEAGSHEDQGEPDPDHSVVAYKDQWVELGDDEPSSGSDNRLANKEKISAINALLKDQTAAKFKEEEKESRNGETRQGKEPAQVTQQETKEMVDSKDCNGKDHPKTHCVAMTQAVQWASMKDKESTSDLEGSSDGNGDKSGDNKSTGSNATTTQISLREASGQVGSLDHKPNLEQILHLAASWLHLTTS